MNEGGVKAWEPHRVQNPLAFSDEEEEDLLDFMYKYKATRKTEFPLEVHGVWGCGLSVCLYKGFAQEIWGPRSCASWGTWHCPSARGRKLSLHHTVRTGH